MMRQPFCLFCLSLGYCRRMSAPIVTDDELANPAFLRDARAFAYRLGVPPDSWLDFLIDAYRDYRGRIVDAAGNEVFLATEVLEQCGIRDWFKAWACKPPGASVRLRAEARERVRVVLTILRACYPHEAQFWGLAGKAANDNEPDGGQR